MNNRINWIDYAKGIGILLVVYGHVSEGIYNAGMTMNENLFTIIDTMIYSFHMPLFFFLSGLFFFSSFEKRGAKANIINKVENIFYPYLIWSLLQGLIEATLSNYTNNNITYQEVFTLLWQPRAQFWFLYVLFFSFVLASILFFINKSTVTIAAITVFFTLIYIFQKSLSQQLTLTFFYNHIVYFFIGILATRINIIDRLNSNKILLFSSILFAISQYWFVVIEGYGRYDKGFVSFIIANIAILFIISLSMQLSKINIRSLAFIGKSSLYIYLIHVLTGSGIRVVLQKIFHVESASTHIIIGCISAVLLSLICFKVSKKYHLNFLFKMPSRNKPAPINI